LEDYPKFIEKISELSDILLEWINSGEIICLISHYEADGICATAIISKLIYNMNGKFHARFVNHIDMEWISDFLEEFDKKENYFVFLDIGAETLHYINRFFNSERVMVIDHNLQRSKKSRHNLNFLNLQNLEIDGNRDISSAGMAYFIVKEINNKKIEMASLGLIEELAPLGVIGALGDNLTTGKKNILTGVNKIIVEDCKKMNLLKDEEDLRFFGQYTSIKESLSQTIDPYIIDITNNEIKTNELLMKLDIPSNIPIKQLNDKKKTELNEELIEKIQNPQELVGINYILLKESKTGPLYDAREFSILLNACGRFGSSSVGLAVCMNDRGMHLKEAIKLYGEYLKKIQFYMDWISTPDNYLETNLIQCIMGNNMINERFIKPVSYIAYKTHKLNPEKIIMGYVDKKDNRIITVFIESEDFIKKEVNIWEALKQTNKKLKIDTKTIGNKIKARVKIPIDIDIKQYLELLDEFVQKQIGKN
jgi:RecJ-like exonuclease